MINYRHNEEKEIAIYYAQLLGEKQAESIIEKGSVDNSDEARILSAFYWKMVDKTVEEDKSGINKKYKDIDMWLEYLCNSLYIYLSNEGYEKEWDEN